MALESYLFSLSNGNIIVIIAMEVIMPSSEGCFACVCVCELIIYVDNTCIAFSTMLAYKSSIN